MFFADCMMQSAFTVCLKYKVLSLNSISGCCGSGTVTSALVHGKSKVMLEEVTVYVLSASKPIQVGFLGSYLFLPDYSICMEE